MSCRRGLRFTHLCVGVCNGVIHQDHDQNGDGDAEVPDDASSLERRERKVETRVRRLTWGLSPPTTLGPDLVPEVP